MGRENLLTNDFDQREILRITVGSVVIGIGGSLATPLLPHHRAYGSRTTAVRLITLVFIRPAEFSVDPDQYTICFPKGQTTTLLRRFNAYCLNAYSLSLTVRAFSISFTAQHIRFSVFRHWSASLALPVLYLLCPLLTSAQRSEWIAPFSVLIGRCTDLPG